MHKWLKWKGISNISTFKATVAETRKSVIIATCGEGGEVIAVTEHYQGRVPIAPKIYLDRAVCAMAKVIINADLHTP